MNTLFFCILGTTTESESCEEMEIAENSLSGVKSFSEDCESFIYMIDFQNI